MKSVFLLQAVFVALKFLFTESNTLISYHNNTLINPTNNVYNGEQDKRNQHQETSTKIDPRDNTDFTRMNPKHPVLNFINNTNSTANIYFGNTHIGNVVAEQKSPQNNEATLRTSPEKKTERKIESASVERDYTPAKKHFSENPYEYTPSHRGY
jgi:hypothetical protein